MDAHATDREGFALCPVEDGQDAVAGDAVVADDDELVTADRAKTADAGSSGAIRWVSICSSPSRPRDRGCR